MNTQYAQRQCAKWGHRMSPDGHRCLRSGCTSLFLVGLARGSDRMPGVTVQIIWRLPVEGVTYHQAGDGPADGVPMRGLTAAELLRRA